MKQTNGWALVCLMAASGPLHAACQYYDGQGPVEASATLDSPIVVSALLPVGAVLSSRVFTDSSTGLVCTQDTELNTGWVQAPSAGSGSSELEGVYATSVPGVGIRIRDQATNALYHWPRRRTPLAAGHYTPRASYQVDLVKTGPVVEGRLRLPLQAVSQQHGALESTGLRFLSQEVEVVLDKPTCSVASDAHVVEVNLGEHHPRDFSGLGSGTVPQAFNLRLACQGGQGGDSLFVHVTLTDATDPGNREDVLNLRSSATATGLGVQVLRPNGQPVFYGADSSVVGNPGQFHAGSVGYGESVFTVALRARYVQTGRVVTPGSAGALATFTFAYN